MGWSGRCVKKCNVSTRSAAPPAFREPPEPAFLAKAPPLLLSPDPLRHRRLRGRRGRPLPSVVLDGRFRLGHGGPRLHLAFDVRKVAFDPLARRIVGLFDVL